MILDLLKRFEGVASYEKGIRYARLAIATSQGHEREAFKFEKTDVLDTSDPEIDASPILATVIKKANKESYDNEYPMYFQITYINQDDETKTALGYIPPFADPKMDCRIIMPDNNEFVKEITAIEPRVDRVELDSTHFLNREDALEVLKFTGNPTSGWSSDSGNISGGVITDVGSETKLTLTTVGNPTTDNVFGIPLGDEYFNDGETNAEVIYNASKVSNFPNEPSEKLYKFRIRFKLPTNYQWLAVGLGDKFKFTLKAFSANQTIVDNYNSVYPNMMEKVDLDTWVVKEIVISEMVFLQLIQDTYPANRILLQMGFVGAPDDDYDFWFDYFDYLHYSGNIGDKIEIIALLGNIGRQQAVQSLMLSEIQYNLKVASLQRFVSKAFKGGLRKFIADNRISISNEYSNDVKRSLLALFSTFVVPSKSLMEESLGSIYQILDPLGSIEVYGDFNNPYRMIVVVNSSDNEFGENDIAILQLFVERYRPAPSTADIIMNFSFGLEESVDITETAYLITEIQLKMGSSTLMSSSNKMGSKTLGTITLPADYP